MSSPRGDNFHGAAAAAGRGRSPPRNDNRGLNNGRSPPRDNRGPPMGDRGRSPPRNDNRGGAPPGRGRSPPRNDQRNDNRGFPPPVSSPRDNFHIPANMERITDAVNPNKNAEQQGKARFKQVTRMHQQILMLAAFALRVLGLPLVIRDIIFLHGGDQWTGVIRHFYQVRCALPDNMLISHCRRCWWHAPMRTSKQQWSAGAPTQ